MILDNIGIRFISTQCSNRKHVPDIVKSFKNMDNGDVKCFKLCGSNLRFIQVKDKSNDTILLTNYNNTNDVVKVYLKNNYTNCDFYEKGITFLQHEYRHKMCGVDIFNRGCSVINVRRRTTRWSMAYFEILINASLVNVFTIINSCYRKKEATKREINVQELPQMYRLNRRKILYELGKCLCKRTQVNNIEKEEIIKTISFEQQIENYQKNFNKKESIVMFIGKYIKKDNDSNKYCCSCRKACCEMHFAANRLCYLCNEFNKEQILILDEEMKKHSEGNK